MSDTLPIMGFRANFSRMMGDMPQDEPRMTKDTYPSFRWITPGEIYSPPYTDVLACLFSPAATLSETMSAR
ncbi:hypothetical protein [Nitrospirillum iridis]|uniref:Uncharacterized protein n=1 Tax=Nitrospirillum iridis TaxID=765888 RepID=A0A7X0B1E9_9PROT|nr:hypothetical protein [Nitrospirillum iridis]MBB6253910.1 hypothetical protein [Nitrospirillum iridis]